MAAWTCSYVGILLSADLRIGGLRSDHLANKLPLTPRNNRANFIVCDSRSCFILTVPRLRKKGVWVDLACTCTVIEPLILSVLIFKRYQKESKSNHQQSTKRQLLYRRKHQMITSCCKRRKKRANKHNWKPLQNPWTKSQNSKGFTKATQGGSYAVDISKTQRPRPKTFSLQTSW